MKRYATPTTAIQWNCGGSSRWMPAPQPAIELKLKLSASLRLERVSPLRRAPRDRGPGGCAGGLLPPQRDFRSPKPSENCLVARIEPENVARLRPLVEQIRFFFDLRANSGEIVTHLRKSAALRGIVAQTGGLRLPGCWDPFELAVRAVLGQQVTVRGASTLAARMVEQFGSLSAATTRGCRSDAYRSHESPCRIAPQPVASGLRREPALGRIGSVFRSDRETVLATWRRSLDRKLHRDACAGGSGCLSVFGPGTIESRRFIIASPTRSTGGDVAALAFLRGFVSLGIVREERIDHVTELRRVQVSYRPNLVRIGWEAVCALDFEGYESRMEMLLARRYDAVEFRRASDPIGLKRLLASYFAGDFTLSMRFLYGQAALHFGSRYGRRCEPSPPEKRVAMGNSRVRLNRPKSARAVGHANSLNPVAIIVPCHRVIGASAALTGYAGEVSNESNGCCVTRVRCPENPLTQSTAA